MTFTKMMTVVMLTIAIHAAAFAQEFPPQERKLSRGARTAWDKAVKQIEKNRKTYEESNAKALATLQRELERSNPAVDNIDELVKEFQAGIFQLDADARPPAPPPPDKDIVVYGGHRYKLFLENLSWEDAQEKCVEMGGHLLVIEEDKEHTFLAKAIQKFSDERAALPKIWHVWLGMKYDKEKDKWFALDGRVQAFSVWVAKNPSQERAVMRENGNWFSRSGVKSDDIFFICEWDK